jgi:ABC-2 type transport system ATP-binding protein
VEVEDRHVRGRVPRAGRTIQGLLRDLDRSGIDLDSIEVLRPTLDDVFLSLTGRSLRDADSADPKAPPSGDEPDGAGDAAETRAPAADAPATHASEGALR